MPDIPSSLRILIAAETYTDVNGAARFAERLAGQAHRAWARGARRRPLAERFARQVVQGAVTVHGVRSHSYFIAPTSVCTVGGRTRDQRCWRRSTRTSSQAHMVLGRYMVKATVRSGRPLVATNHFMPENLAAHAPVREAGS
jgi:hypothetical protein